MSLEYLLDPNIRFVLSGFYPVGWGRASRVLALKVLLIGVGVGHLVSAHTARVDQDLLPSWLPPSGLPQRPFSSLPSLHSSVEMESFAVRPLCGMLWRFGKI